MFGPHLMLDCYGCDTKKLLDPNFVLNFLNSLPDMLGMRKIGGPFILEYPENSETWDKGGVSAIVIIAESHISIHTFPVPNGYMNIDIFSCKNFDTELAVQKITEAFGAERWEKNLLMRGKEFPKEELLATNCMEQQRERALKPIARISRPRPRRLNPAAFALLDVPQRL